MTININDLDDRFELNDTSFFSSNQNSLGNLEKLSSEELKISGGAGYSTPRTVVIGDDDLDVYIIDNAVPTNIVYNADVVKLKPGKQINFGNGSVAMRKNGNIDFTFSVSDSSSSSS